MMTSTRVSRNIDDLDRSTSFFFGEELLFNHHSNDIYVLDKEVQTKDLQALIAKDYLCDLKEWLVDYTFRRIAGEGNHIQTVISSKTLKKYFSEHVNRFVRSRKDSEITRQITLSKLVESHGDHKKQREYCSDIIGSYLDLFVSGEDVIPATVWKSVPTNLRLVMLLSCRFRGMRFDDFLLQCYSVSMSDAAADNSYEGNEFHDVLWGLLDWNKPERPIARSAQFSSLRTISAYLMVYGVSKKIWLLPNSFGKNPRVFGSVIWNFFSLDDLPSGRAQESWARLLMSSTMSVSDELPLDISRIANGYNKVPGSYGLNDIIPKLNEKYKELGKIFPLGSVSQRVINHEAKIWDEELFYGYDYTKEWKGFVTVYMDSHLVNLKSKVAHVRQFVKWAVHERGFRSPWDIQPDDIKGAGISSEHTFFSFINSLGIKQVTKQTSWSGSKVMFRVVAAAAKLDLDSDNKVDPFSLINDVSFGRRGSGSKTHRARMLPEISEVLLDVLLSPDERGVPTFEWLKTKSKLDRFKWKNPETGEIESIWCPSRAISLAILMLIPIRGVQVRWLDQGLMDGSYYDNELMTLVKNTHDLSKFKYEDGQSHEEKYGRSSGVLTLDDDVITKESELSIFINTNKTQLWNPEQKTGYIIPWPYRTDESSEGKTPFKWLNRIYDLLFFQRSWMEKYDPSPTPLRFDHVIEDKMRVSDAGDVINNLPFFTPLLRDLSVAQVSYSYNDKINHAHQPISKSKIEALYADLTLEVENKLTREKGFNITLTKEGGARGRKPIFDIHSLRVAGISKLIDQGMPAHIVMEYVAGHQSIATTLHYFKTNSVMMREKLIETAMDGDLLDGFDVITNNHTDNLSNYCRGLVRPADVGSTSEDSIPDNFAMLASVEGGVCPMGGHGSPSCMVGYTVRNDEVKGQGGKDTYTQVVGGCSNCRFWMTGPDFIVQQTLELNRTMIDMRARGRERSEIKRAISDLEWELACLGQVDEFKRQRIQTEITVATTRLHSLDENLTPIMQGWYNRYEALQFSKEKYEEAKKLDVNEGSELILIKNDEDIDFSPETVQINDFGLVRTVIEQARIFKRKAIPLPDEPSRMLREFVDSIMVHESPKHLLATIPNKELATHAASILAGTMSDMVGDDAVQKSIDSGGQLELPEAQREGLVKLTEILHSQAKCKQLPSMKIALEELSNDQIGGLTYNG